MKIVASLIVILVYSHLAQAKICQKLFLSEGLSLDWVESQLDRLDNLDKPNARVTTRGFRWAAQSRKILDNHKNTYTNELPRGEISDQKSSGRCWIFTGLNLYRTLLLEKGVVPSSFHFSETYINFFSLLEKSNSYFEDLRKDLETATLPSKVIKAIDSSDKISAGGSFPLFLHLIKKYGVVPRTMMKDTKSSGEDKYIVEDIRLKLMKYGDLMLQMLAHARNSSLTGETLQRFNKLKEKAMREVFEMLTVHYGAPPLKFEVDGRSMTPQEYASEVLLVNPDDFVMIESDPKYQRGHFLSGGNAELASAPKLNLETSRLSELIKISIDKGFPLYFGSDYGSRDMDKKSGIMHPGLYERDRIYGFQKKGSRMEFERDLRIKYGNTESNHGMLILGYDQPSGNETPIKFLVENSHGTDSGDRGYFHMYREWLEKNVIRIFVHKSVLSPKEIALISEGPKDSPGKW